MRNDLATSALRIVRRRTAWVLLAAAFPAAALSACNSSVSEPVDTAPVAVVASLSGAVRGDTVILDGTGSSDADGDSLTFAWTLVSAPAGSAAALSPANGVSPAFVADKVGSYVVSLVVNDGRRSSAPASRTVSVATPAPNVSIASPADLSVVTASPLTVTGTVDDPSATVRVNGVAATVDGSGGWTASVPIQSGNNSIDVEATNPTGVGTTAISVILNTVGAPVVIITTPDKTKGFLVGSAYLEGATPTSEALKVSGVIHVFTTETGNAPAVTVDGRPATIGDTAFSGCPTVLPKRCFKFTLTDSLALGLHTIVAVGTDVLGGVGKDSVSGASDFAFRPTDSEWNDEEKKTPSVQWSGPTPRRAALTQTNPQNPRQNNRAHEMDGCSVPVLINLGGTWRNNPMHFATQNVAPTDFGSGVQPPAAADHFIHGKKPARVLPCSTHDVCYQTVGSNKDTCDNNFYADMRSVCTKSYPTISHPALHPVYSQEQSNCYGWAKKYYDGVHVAGQGKFDDRQKQYAWP